MALQSGCIRQARDKVKVGCYRLNLARPTLTSCFWAAATAFAALALAVSARTLSNVPKGSATDAGTAMSLGNAPRISCRHYSLLDQYCNYKQMLLDAVMPAPHRCSVMVTVELGYGMCFEQRLGPASIGKQSNQERAHAPINGILEQM